MPNQFPAPDQFESGAEQALAMLARLGPPPDRNWVSSVTLSQCLQKEFGIRIHWRTIDALLSDAEHGCARRRRNNRWEFSLLGRGESILAGGGGRFVLVEPENALQSTMDLHGLLAGLRGVIRVCDPYLDDVSLEHLSSCPKASEARILTMNVRDSGKLRRLHAAAATEGRRLGIRVAPNGALHDRYLIDDSRLFILGTSLNGFGKKQSMVIQAGTDFRRELLSAFDRHWNTAAPWP